jgi:hypothetical protein
MMDETAKEIVDRVAEETGDTAVIVVDLDLLGSDQAAAEHAGDDASHHLTIVDSVRTPQDLKLCWTFLIFDAVEV